MTLYAYIQKRIAGRRTCGIVQDLIDDMERDKDLKGKTGVEIVFHISVRACFEAREALKRFISSYRQYCKAHGYQAERLNPDSVSQ